MFKQVDYGNRAGLYQGREGVGRIFNFQDKRVAQAGSLEALDRGSEKVSTGHLTICMFDTVQRNKEASPALEISKGQKGTMRASYFCRGGRNRSRRLS